MFKKKEPPIVISVGGSLIVPNGGINTKFLTNLNAFVRKHVKEGKRFFLVAGGGATARQYIDGGREVIGHLTEEDLDWLGIHSTRLNAHLLRTIFMDIAHPRIIENYERKLINWREPVVIGAGWKPGWSTDYDAVVLARDYKARLIINLSDIDWVYDKDPNKYLNAKPIKEMTWNELQRITGLKWVPGFSAPFDPMAVKLANEIHIRAIITNGNDFANIEKIVDGEEFKGTVIKPYKIDADFYDKAYYAGEKGGIRFGYIGSTRGRFFNNLSNFYRALMIKLVLNPQSTLDVGAGTGYLVKWLRFFGIDAYGLDLSPEAIKLAKTSVKPFLKTGDTSHLPYKDKSFDLVVSYDLLEHVEGAKIKKALTETIRVSRKHVFHKIYTLENDWVTYVHGKDYGHLSLFSSSFWKQMFSSVKGAKLVPMGLLKLPSFFETAFLLKKTNS